MILINGKEMKHHFNIEVVELITRDGYTRLDYVYKFGHSDLLRVMLKYENVRKLIDHCKGVYTPLSISCVFSNKDSFDISTLAPNSNGTNIEFAARYDYISKYNHK